MTPSDTSTNLPTWRIASALVLAGTALVYQAAAWLLDQRGPHLFSWMGPRR